MDKEGKELKSLCNYQDPDDRVFKQFCERGIIATE